MQIERNRILYHFEESLEKRVKTVGKEYCIETGKERKDKHEVQRENAKQIEEKPHKLLLYRNIEDSCSVKFLALLKRRNPKK